MPPRRSPPPPVETGTQASLNAAAAVVPTAAAAAADQPKASQFFKKAAADPKSPKISKPKNSAPDPAHSVTFQVFGYEAPRAYHGSFPEECELVFESNGDGVHGSYLVLRDAITKSHVTTYGLEALQAYDVISDSDETYDLLSLKIRDLGVFLFEVRLLNDPVRQPTTTTDLGFFLFEANDGRLLWEEIRAFFAMHNVRPPPLCVTLHSSVPLLVLGPLSFGP
jgi:hypothetical protein